MIEKGEEVIIVCTRVSEHTSHFTDDIRGPCDGCGEELQWRPHNPTGKHMCFQCTVAMKLPEDRVEITRMTMLEVLEYLKTHPVRQEEKLDHSDHPSEGSREDGEDDGEPL